MSNFTSYIVYNSTLGHTLIDQEVAMHVHSQWARIRDYSYYSIVHTLSCITVW